MAASSPLENWIVILTFRVIFAAVLLALSSSCSSTIGDQTPPDAAVDAAAPLPDALAPGLRDGELCFISPNDPLGGCTVGYACVKVGAGPDVCRKECPTLQLSCLGYVGPGFPICTITYNDEQGQPVGNVCLLVCEDENNTLRGCDDGGCDGTCPGTWECLTDPNNFGLKSCQ